MSVTVNITKKEYDFINPNTGERMSPQQFNQRHSQFGMGGLGANVLREKNEAEAGENS